MRRGERVQLTKRIGGDGRTVGGQQFQGGRHGRFLIGRFEQGRYNRDHLGPVCTDLKCRGRVSQKHCESGVLRDRGLLGRGHRGLRGCAVSITVFSSPVNCRRMSWRRRQGWWGRRGWRRQNTQWHAAITIVKRMRSEQKLLLRAAADILSSSFIAAAASAARPSESYKSTAKAMLAKSGF